MVSEYKNVLKIGIVTMENSKEVPQKIKNRTTIWPSNFISEYFSKKVKIKTRTLIQKDICIPMFTEHYLQ